MEQTDKKKNPKKEPVVPDGGWGWMVVFSSFMIHFIMDGITYSMSMVFLEPMRDRLGLDLSTVSTIFGILPAVTLTAGPIATVLTNMYGCRLVAITGTCIAALGFLLSRLWANVWFYYITIGFTGGLGFSLMYIPAIVSVGVYFEKKRTLAMGIAVCGSGVGTMVFPPFMTQLVRVKMWISYENALVLESGLIMICLMCAFLMIPLPQEPSEQRRLERKMRKERQQEKTDVFLLNQNGSPTVKDDPTEIAIIKKSPILSFFNELKEQIDLNLLRNAAFSLFVFSNFLTSLGFNVVYNYADDLANDAKVPLDDRSYIITSMGLANIFGRIITGYVGDRKSVNRLLLFIITFIMSGIATIVAPFCGSSVFSHMGYASVFGFFSGGYVTLTAIVLIDIVGINKLSDAFGVALLFIGVATAIGTPVVGKMKGAFTGFSRPYLWPYVIFGALPVLAGLFLFAIPLLQRKKATENQTEMVDDSILQEKDFTFEKKQQQI